MKPSSSKSIWVLIDFLRLGSMRCANRIKYINVSRRFRSLKKYINISKKQFRFVAFQNHQNIIVIFVSLTYLNKHFIHQWPIIIITLYNAITSDVWLCWLTTNHFHFFISWLISGLRRVMTNVVTQKITNTFQSHFTFISPSSYHQILRLNSLKMMCSHYGNKLRPSFNVKQRWWKRHISPNNVLVRWKIKRVVIVNIQKRIYFFPVDLHGS